MYSFGKVILCILTSLGEGKDNSSFNHSHSLENQIELSEKSTILGALHLGSQKFGCLTYHSSF